MLLLGILMGFVFGFALEKSRVFEPGVIFGQMRLRNFLTLRVFLSAMTTGLLCTAFLFGIGLIQLHPKTLQWGPDVLGGLLLGCGISLARACPATLPVQLVAGCRGAWITLVGAVAGALCFLLVEPFIAAHLRPREPESVTLDQVAGLPFSALAVAVAVVCIATLVAMERLRPWGRDLSPGDSPPPGPPPGGTATRDLV